MIQQVSHPVAGSGPAAFALALDVAYELHPPVTRAPEVASVAVARRGVSAARSRRRSPARG
ncbi:MULTISPECIES: hypothetical protein [unclassified Streptomyces]|uniref:hypothetical protein n=1 Tax=unclassified Streptomyces TaxID=2593676 RepID=UPI0008521725|nr:hypothetical protein [Streptomyces sp. LUP47B]MBW8817813.1 hypothetical protein [Streptomyces sp.]